MKDLLKGIFNNVFLKSSNNKTITILEKGKDGKCSCIFKNSDLYEFHINNLKATKAPFISKNESSFKLGMQDTCDGIILDSSKNLYTIYFIELKRTISNNLKKAINQLQSTRIRLLSLLSITNVNLTKITSVFIVVGNISTNDLSIEIQNKRERSTNGEIALLLSDIQKNKETTILSVPKSLKEKINHIYQTNEKIKLLHYKCDEIIDINNIN